MKRTLYDVEHIKGTEGLARFAKALGHPTRIKILQILASREFCYTGELVDDLPLAQSTISQHLKELKEAGLIKGEITPPKIKYCIDVKNWQTAKALFTEFFDSGHSKINC
jgi:ArsR family transcriptional regulator